MIEAVARAGDHLENQVSGERIVFVRTAAETGGEVLEMDDFWTRPDHRTPEHVHPQMQERWEVISGRCCFRVAGVERIAGPGEVVVAPAGAPHMAWSLDDAPAHLRIQMRPALRWEEFVVRLFALANEDGSGEREAPALVRMAELLREFPREIATSP